MNDDRQLIIHYNNGAKLTLSFPVQVKNSTAAVMEGAKRILEGDKLTIEANGKLFVVPWSSVQHIELTPIPAALPFGTIKNARVVT
jgi:hypothetical protein